MCSTTSESMQYYLSQWIQISQSNAQHNFWKYAKLSKSVNTDFTVKCAAQLLKVCNIIWVSEYRFHSQMRSTTSQSMQYYLSLWIQISGSNAQHNFSKYAILFTLVKKDFTVQCAAQLLKVRNIIYVSEERFHNKMRSTTSRSTQYYLSQWIQISRSNAQHNFSKYAISSTLVNTDLTVKCAAQIFKVSYII